VIGITRAETTGPKIAGEGMAMLSEPGGCASFDYSGQARIGTPQGIHAFDEPEGIEFVDREGAVAALRASRAACEPCACSPCCVGKRGIYNLYQFLIAFRHAHAA
jgi:hypothetical protein